MLTKTSFPRLAAVIVLLIAALVPVRTFAAVRAAPALELNRVDYRDDVVTTVTTRVLPTSAPLDESKLTDDERALLTQASDQSTINVIVRLNVGYSSPSQASAQQLAVQTTTVSLARASLLRSLPSSDAQVIADSTKWVIPYIAISVNKSGLQALLTSSAVASVQIDGRNELLLDAAEPVIRAPQAWAQGYTGSGQTVAIIDTGVSASHPFLGGRVVAEACYSGNGVVGNTNCPNGLLSQTGAGASSPTPCFTHTSDAGCAHGTHVSGIAAGFSSTSFSGVAPSASIIGVDVFSADLGAYDSDIISGLNYVYGLRTTYAIASANMSIGNFSAGSTTNCDSHLTAMTDIFHTLRDAKIAPVVATGNNGNHSIIAYPGCISYAVSIGASSDADGVASFSNTSPTIQTLFAPGVNIYSSVPVGSIADIQGTGFDSWNGTSMATPFVTGAFAVYRQFAPTASVDTIVNAFRTYGVGVCVTGGVVPRLDLYGAINQLAPSAPCTPATPQPPANDLIANATNITTLPSNPVVLNIVAATTTGGDPSFCESVSRTVWYQYTSPGAQNLTVTTAGSEYDTVLAVFDGSTHASLGCNDDTNPGVVLTSAVTVAVTSGTYLIGIGAFGTGTTSSSTLRLHVSGDGVFNTAPTISNITNKTINEDTATNAIAFTVGDAETAAGDLTLSATSSNTTRVPLANIVYGGSGVNRTVTVTPAANQFGNATITVTVSDSDHLTTSDSFILTITPINDPPTISNVNDQTTLLSTAASSIPVTIGDVDNTPASLTMTGISSNTTLLPVANVTFGGSSASRTVSLTPAAGKTGTATVTLTVHDANSGIASDSFVLTVLPAVDAIFSDGFESSNLTAWTSSVIDGGDLAASAASALVGTRGVRAVLDDATPIYVTDDTPNAEIRYRARFYLDPNALVMANNDNFVLFYGYQSPSTAVLQVQLHKSGSIYQTRVGALDDAGIWTYSAYVTLSDAPHFVEIDWRAASGVGSNNGRVTLWVDEALQPAVTGIDNDTRRIDRVRLGAIAGIDAGTHGVIFFDAFASRRRTYIGPEPAGFASLSEAASTPAPFAVPPVSDDMNGGAPDWSASGLTLTAEADAGGKGLGWQASGGATATLVWNRQLDLRAVANAKLSVASMLTSADMPLIQASFDGESWTTIATIRPSADWRDTVVDLHPFIGQVFQLRFVWESHSADDVWRLDNFRVE